MTATRTIARAAAGAAAIAAIAAPGALAKPADYPLPDTSATQTSTVDAAHAPSMRPSVAEAASRDAAYQRSHDQRTPDAVDAATPRGTIDARPAGMPTWPVNPQAITSPGTSAQPKASDFDWGDAAIGAGFCAALVILGGIGVAATRRGRVNVAG